MTINPQSDWIEGFAKLPKVPDSSWADNMANKVDSFVTSKVALTGLTGSVTFTFNKSVFASMLRALSPVTSSAAGTLSFANAWGAAITASSIVVLPGAYLISPSPPTLFSVIISSLIDPPSIALAVQFLATTLASAVPVPDANSSIFGPTFRSAFLMCTATVTGLNSLPIPPAGPGPQPLVAPLLPFY